MTRKTGGTKTERRKGPQRVTTDRRRDKSRWDPQKADRREGFGRRTEDKLWDRLVDEID